MKKKLIAGMTSAALIASLSVPAFAASSFTDIEGSYAKAAIEELVAKGIINGVDANHFNPDGSLTRAQFAKIITLALGLDTSATTSSFSDVSGWAVGYVEAAKSAGLIDGVGNGQYDPNGIVNREQAAKILVNALKTKMDLDMTADLNFPDKDQVSDWAKSFVAVAAKYGLIKGNVDGTFNPKGNATRAQAAVLAQRLLTEIETAAYEITPGTANLAVGQSQQFTVAGAKNVVWSVSGNGVIDQNGNFVGSAAGSATITAVADGKTLTQAVTVYGAAAAVKVSGVTEVVANGKSAQVLTATVVDANGNAVENFKGSATVSATANGAAKFISKDDTTPDYATDSNIISLSFENGKATFQVVGGTVAGLKDTVTISALADSNSVAVTNYTSATYEVKTVAQVATSIKVTADKKALAANANDNIAVVSAKVLDQDGKDMISGTYGLKFNVSGPSQWNDTNDTKEKSLSFTGGQSAPSVTVESIQGQTGTITVTVTGEGLASGSVTINAAIAGNASKLVVANADSSATTNEFVQGAANKVTFNVTTNDANGNPATYNVANGSVKVYVTDQDGNAATHLNVVQSGVSTDVVEGGVVLSGTSFDITVDTDGAYAGTYSVVVKDTATSNTLTAADAQAVTVKAAAASALSLSVANNYVAASNPSTTFTVKVTDTYGNKATKSGVPVTFTATGNGAAKAGFNGGSQVTAPTITVNTDANGEATVTLAAQAYNNTSWSVVASSNGYTNSSAKTMTVVYNTTASLKINLKATGTNSTSQVIAGSALTISVDQLDAYGNVISTGTENDIVKVTVSNPKSVNFPDVGATGVTLDTVNGTIQGTVTQINNYLAFGLTGKTAGAVTFTAQDLSVNAASGSSAINVVAGQLAGFALFDANGKVVSTDNKVTVESNKEVVLYVKPVDSQKNVVAANAAFTVNLVDGNGGQFRTTSNGSSVTTLSFANGATSATVYYVNSTAGSYTPSVSYAQTVNAASSTVTAAAATVTAGASNITLTVTPKDQLGNNISGMGVSAFTVASSLAGATPSVVSATETAAGSGVYTVVVTDTKAGSQTLTVSVNGTALTQTAAVTVNAAAIDATQSTATIDTALALNATSTVTATAKDQYGNVISGHAFYLDITVTNATATTAESYTVDGTAYTATTANVALVGTTDANGVVTFTIAVPATVDTGDGVSVQVKTASAGSNVGNAFSFTK